MNPPTLTLFYDGLSWLCAREIEHYRRHLPAESTRFVDITGPAFDASSFGLDPGAVHRALHVQVGGQLRTGADAFLAIFDAIPRYRWLARLGQRWPIYFCLRTTYAGFARIRPWLPKRRESQSAVRRPPSAVNC